jgi:hypothetical protein
MIRWPELEQLDPRQFRKYSRTTTVAFAYVEFGVLAAMAYYEAPLRWMIALVFLLGALLITGAVREAAYWLAVHHRGPNGLF